MNPDGTIPDNTNITGSDYTNSSSQANTPAQNRYTLNKDERTARRRIWRRYRAMADNGDRIEAERDWQKADQQFRMWTPEQDPDDWRSNLVLPDAFSAIQTEMQETIERNSRPELTASEASNDREAKEHFYNQVLNYNMDSTSFDMEFFKAKYSAAIRGTSFLFDYYRVDRREVQDATDVDADGNLTYQTKTITDFDDDFCEWIPNELVFVDEAVDDINYARDCVRREIMHVDEFKRVYKLRPDFQNIEYVRAGGDTEGKQFFQMPKDMDRMDVEILHYYNRALDRYDVLANNILIRFGPLPWKHKELPIAVVYHYRVPGRFWGMGVPKVVYSLSEERRSLRMLNLDRQKMQINKMFLVNDQVSLDDEDLITRPHGMIEVNTNGLPINNSIMPLEYGDIPTSYMQTEEVLLEDIRRATGIDDRIADVQSGTTATQAAMQQQTSQKRINLIASVAEKDTMVRIGKIKWSNIQFYYPAGRVADETGTKASKAPTYKQIRVQDQVFDISTDDDTDEQRLVVSDYDGTTVVELNKKFATFLQGDFDVTMGAEAHITLSKPIRQAKANEMLAGIAANPVLLNSLDADKTVAQLLKLNDFAPKDWMKNSGMTPADWMILADNENRVMEQGQVLNGTPNATQEHTMMHLHYTQTEAYKKLSYTIQQIFKDHILQEHDANPLTGSSADALNAANSQAGEMPTGAPPGAPPGSAGPTGAPTPGAAPQLNSQPVDIQPQAPVGPGGGSNNPSGTAGGTV